MVHPYRTKLENSIQEQKDLLELYETKKHLLINLIIVNPVDAVEKLQNINCRIETIELTGKIRALSQVIQSKQQYFDEFMKRLTADEKDVNANYDYTLKKCVELAEKNAPGVREFFSRNDMAKCETDLEQKIRIFKELKAIIAANR